MRFNRDIISILVLVVLFSIAGLILGGHGAPQSRVVGPEDAPDPSVYNDRASGSRALFEWSDRLGYKSEVLTHNWSTLPSSQASLLFVIAPSFAQDSTALTSSDWTVLQAWLAKGHAAVFLTSDMGGTDGVGKDFADAIGLVVQSVAHAAPTTDFAPNVPSRDSLGVMSIHSADPGRITQTSPSGVELFGDSGGALVVKRREGQGWLYVIGGDLFLSNNNLARSENSVFAANVLSQFVRPGGRVLFDEYHHGDAELPANVTIWKVLGRPLQLALIQLMIAFLVLVAILGVRLGPPIPLLRGKSRSSAEYVTSLAGLYQRANASIPVLETIYRQFVRDVSSRLGLAPDVDLRTLARLAAQRGRLDPARITDTLVACEHCLDTRVISEAQLMTLVRQIEQIRKEIGIV